MPQVARQAQAEPQVLDERLVVSLRLPLQPVRRQDERHPAGVLHRRRPFRSSSVTSRGSSTMPVGRSAASASMAAAIRRRTSWPARRRGRRLPSGQSSFSTCQRRLQARRRRLLSIGMPPRGRHVGVEPLLQLGEVVAGGAHQVAGLVVVHLRQARPERDQVIFRSDFRDLPNAIPQAEGRPQQRRRGRTAPGGRRWTTTRCGPPPTAAAAAAWTPAARAADRTPARAFRPPPSIDGTQRRPGGTPPPGRRRPTARPLRNSRPHRQPALKPQTSQSVRNIRAGRACASRLL